MLTDSQLTEMIWAIYGNEPFGTSIRCDLSDSTLALYLSQEGFDDSAENIAQLRNAESTH